MHIDLLALSPQERYKLLTAVVIPRPVAWVTSVGGSITGEHGIGWSQRRYLPLAAQPASIDLMRSLKRAFDPLGILNPGKIFLDP